MPGVLHECPRLGSGAGASFVPCGVHVGVFGGVREGDDGRDRWARGGRNLYRGSDCNTWGCDIVDGEGLYEWKGD